MPADGQTGVNNARNRSDTHETTARIVLVAWDGSALAQVVDARWYMGRSRSASVVYCSVWVRRRGGATVSGSGCAGGGGYHKPSAAFQDAAGDAGITLSVEVGGVGDSAVCEAMLAIAEAAGYSGCPMAVV